tara:strand:+ start:596 stop:916 length:321 start_codon:yes stop_codon:yes gene_type:complete
MGHNMTPTVSKAIRNLINNPQVTFNMDGDTIIGWDTSNIGIAQPTQSAIDTEVARLQAEYDAQDYARKREAEYPKIGDQLDKIYHEGIDAWKADMITPIKNKYSKG